jgi:hypothetical protein
MKEIADLSSLRIGEKYLIEVKTMEQEYNKDTDTDEMVEKKYKFKGTYHGESVPEILDADDHMSVLSPEELEYIYVFSPYQVQQTSKIVERVNGRRRMKYVVSFVDSDPEESFPLGIYMENALRISQRDVTEGNTKVYLSVESNISQQVHTADRLLRKKKIFEKGIARDVGEYFGGKSKKKRTKKKHVKSYKKFIT